MSERRWQVRHKGLKEAIELLGLENGVDITPSGRISLKRGYYAGLKEGRHQVTVASGVSPAAASRILWHELTHARQREEAGSEIAFLERRAEEEAELVRTLGRRTLIVSRPEHVAAYHAMPMEAEARENMEFAELIPLAEAPGTLRLKGRE